MVRQYLICFWTPLQKSDYSSYMRKLLNHLLKKKTWSVISLLSILKGHLQQKTNKQIFTTRHLLVKLVHHYLSFVHSVYTNNCFSQICLHQYLLQSNMFTLKLETSKYNRNSGNSIYNILGAITFYSGWLTKRWVTILYPKKNICTKNLKVVEQKKRREKKNFFFRVG